jgi:HEPN domain-containing protein
MPSAVELLLQVAEERGTDANVLKREGRLLAAVYLAGYMVECRLKAFLQHRGRRFPTSGREGHDLRGLWEAAGFRLQDISGNKHLFLETWTTSLRYERRLPNGSDFVTLYQGAVELAGYIQTRLRRKSSERF